MIENIVNPVSSAQKPTKDVPATPAGAKPAAQANVVDTAPISPRLKFDAISGVVVTEFLKNGNDVQAQTPSAAVLAYLRAGLSADGLSKNDAAKDKSEAHPADV